MKSTLSNTILCIAFILHISVEGRETSLANLYCMLLTLLCTDIKLGTQLLYAGRAAGPNYIQQGGGADLLCLPDIAEYLSANSPDNNRARLQGVEIQSTVDNLNLRDHNLPCAVHYTPTRSW